MVLRDRDTYWLGWQGWQAGSSNRDVTNNCDWIPPFDCYQPDTFQKLILINLHIRSCEEIHRENCPWCQLINDFWKVSLVQGRLWNGFITTDKCHLCLETAGNWIGVCGWQVPISPTRQVSRRSHLQPRIVRYTCQSTSDRVGLTGNKWQLTSDNVQTVIKTFIQTFLSWKPGINSSGSSPRCGGSTQGSYCRTAWWENTLSLW